MSSIVGWAKAVFPEIRLPLLQKGLRGTYVPQGLFTAHYDDGDVSLRGMEHCNHWKQELRRRYVS